MLEALPGMVMVELSNDHAVAMMKIVSRRHPWNWAADIGEVPPGHPEYSTTLAGDSARRQALLAQLATAYNDGTAAALVGPDGNGGDRFLASAADAHAEHGGNPCYSAAMIAIGDATSAANIRESVVVFYSDGQSPVGIDEFGHSSQGACELFRPAAVLTNLEFDTILTNALQSAGVCVLVG